MNITTAFVFISLGFTIAAFAIKGVSSAMLHFAAIVCWIIAGYILHSTLTLADNTYMPTATFLFATIMILIHIAGGINVMLSLRAAKPKQSTYDEEKEQLKQNIYDKTRRSRGY